MAVQRAGGGGEVGLEPPAGGDGGRADEHLPGLGADEHLVGGGPGGQAVIGGELLPGLLLAGQQHGGLDGVVSPQHRGQRCQVRWRDRQPAVGAVAVDH